LYDVGDGRRTQRERTIDRCKDRVGLLHQQKRDIDAAIAELNDFIALLEQGSRADHQKD
jgi:hypothetical protein